MLNIILKFFGKLGEYLIVLLKNNVKADLERVLPIVTRYVNEVKNDTSLLNAEKRVVVFKSVSQDLQNSGSVIASSLINLAIELAVQSSKN
jgi:hypothetical protein